jgi:hypothetical protein
MREKHYLYSFSVVGLMLAAARPQAASGALIGYLTTAQPNELAVGDKWIKTGFRIDWSVSENSDGTWHYAYTLSDEDGHSLRPLTSHVILQLSEAIKDTDLLNFIGDAGTRGLGTWGPAPSNPGFPADESIFGIKVNMTGGQTHFEFDSTHRPMWGDFYSKGGNKSFAYNDDVGVAVANPYDYFRVPVDVTGRSLDKILVPDTIPGPNPVPEPVSAALALVGALMCWRKDRRW